jgi:hypothetical protein
MFKSLCRFRLLIDVFDEVDAGEIERFVPLKIEEVNDYWDG